MSTALPPPRPARRARPADPAAAAPDEVAPERDWTPYERYVALFPDGMKGDLIDGEAVIDMSTSSLHERLFIFLVRLLGNYAEERELGEVLGSRTLVRIDDENGYEPDVLFIRAARRDIVGAMSVEEAVDLAVEIVSPTSGRRDRETKFEGYQRIGVPEYWLIDPYRREATLYQLDPEGLYRAAPLSTEGTLDSRSLVGFRLDPQVLFFDPLPPVRPLVRALLETPGDTA